MKQTFQEKTAPENYHPPGGDPDTEPVPQAPKVHAKPKAGKHHRPKKNLNNSQDQPAHKAKENTAPNLKYCLKMNKTTRAKPAPRNHHPPGEDPGTAPEPPAPTKEKADAGNLGKWPLRGTRNGISSRKWNRLSDPTELGDRRRLSTYRWYPLLDRASGKTQREIWELRQQIIILWFVAFILIPNYAKRSLIT